MLYFETTVTLVVVTCQFCFLTIVVSLVIQLCLENKKIQKDKTLTLMKAIL